jgi:hypothetical protein
MYLIIVRVMLFDLFKKLMRVPSTSLRHPLHFRWLSEVETTEKSEVETTEKSKAETTEKSEAETTEKSEAETTEKSEVETTE